MDSDKTAYLIYLTAMLVFIGSSVVVSGRSRLPTLLRQALTWVFIFGVFIAGAGLWQRVQARLDAGTLFANSDGTTPAPSDASGLDMTTTTPGTPGNTLPPVKRLGQGGNALSGGGGLSNNKGTYEIARGYDGHYHTTVTLNGVPVEFVIDTGATDIVLSQEDAERIGINTATLTYDGLAGSANGTVAFATTEIGTMTMGPFTDSNVEVVVNQGEMFGSLLGMAYLNRFQKVSIEGQKLVISRN